MTQRPSEVVQEKISTVISDAIREALDWECTEKILEPALEYVRKCVTKSVNDGQFLYFSGVEYTHDDFGKFTSRENPNGLIFSVSVLDEDETVVEAPNLSLVDILSNQYEDCFQSQADIVLGLERTLVALKNRYKETYGIDCTREAVEAERKRRWPNAGGNS